MRNYFQTFILTAALLFSAAVNAQSHVKFIIKNAGFNISGYFSDFKADVTYDKNNVKASKFNGTVKVTSINTSNNARDKHLRTDDFFDVAKYPEMTFKSTVVSPVSATKIKVVGDLTIKNVTKKILFEVDIEEKGGKTIFTTKLGINRLDYSVGTSSWTLANDLTMDIRVEK